MDKAAERLSPGSMSFAAASARNNTKVQLGEPSTDLLSQRAQHTGILILMLQAVLWQTMHLGLAAVAAGAAKFQEGHVADAGHAAGRPQYTQSDG